MIEKYQPKPLDIPIVGIGSQPQEAGDENFDFMPSPGVMPTYSNPVLPEPEDIADLTAAQGKLAELLEIIQHYQVGTPARRLDISHLDAANLDLVNQVLNEGEVSIVVDSQTRGRVQIQESVLTGVWRLRTETVNGETCSDVIEVGDIPAVVSEQTFSNASWLHATPQPDAATTVEAALMNALPLLTELAEKSAQWQPGQDPHVINLSLLPLSPEDLSFLGEQLGVGPVTILSRGYGNCRIGSTAQHNIWWVKYYNSEDHLILNTLEVVDVPEVAKAAAEDLVDSAERLYEILAIYQPVQPAGVA